MKAQIQANGYGLISRLSEGNPGAINVMLSILSMTNSFEIILSFDEYEIYGPNIWILFKDICDSDTKKLIILINSLDCDLFSIDKLKDFIENAVRSPLSEEEWKKLEKDLIEYCANRSKSKIGF